MEVFSTKECAWQHFKLTMLGRTIMGLRGFEFGKTKEAEYLYGAGDEPIDIQTGQKAYPGNVKILKYELDMLNDAARAAGFEDITEVPHEAISITGQYKKRPTDKSRTAMALGVRFTEIKAAMEVNAKMTEVTLPFLSMKTTFL